MKASKENIIKEFSKYKNTEIPYDEIDEGIREFIKELNKSNHITTIYCCEGHKDMDWAYLYFNVSDKGWDIFWGNLLPELLSELKENDLISLTKMFIVDVTANEWNSGITIHRRLSTDVFQLEDGEVIETNWEAKKKLFWELMETLFLKYYKN